MSQQVVINVSDINDNTPTFSEAQKDGSMDMDIPENIPSGTVRRLPPALDKVFIVHSLIECSYFTYLSIISTFH